MARFYTVVTVPTPRRDIDLFGPVTARIDAAREPGGAGAPLLYLSAYVDDPDLLARRLAEVLASMDQPLEDRPASSRPTLVEPAQEVLPYSLPDFVEDVDWEERLFLPEDINQTDWRAWTEAFSRRVDLATSSTQLATLESTNGVGLRACPGRFRAPLGRKLHARYIETDDQVAA